MREHRLRDLLTLAQAPDLLGRESFDGRQAQGVELAHGLAVDEAGRRSGVATALMAAAVDWLRSRGAPRVVLGTAEQNAAAQRLFEKLGFRRTMIEMTREL